MLVLEIAVLQDVEPRLVKDVIFEELQGEKQV